jgi:hypothetical protein
MYQAATAKIEGDTVVLSSQMVKDPIHVRYGPEPGLQSLQRRRTPGIAL